jgi:cytochrome c oxidase subunit 4
MGDSSQHGVHIVVPFNELIKVGVWLVILTILTVYTAKFVHLGVFAGLVAFSIAAVKAFLVMGVFMGLKYENKLNRLIFASGFFFLALLAFFCVIDIWTRIQITNTL